MAASVSSLGPPNIGPGNNANTTGFCVMASTKPGVYSNREPIAGNTLCHKVWWVIRIRQALKLHSQ